MILPDLLDQKIEGFRINKGDYPSKIIMSKETKDKLFLDIKSKGVIIESCWVDSEDNYRGIPIEIKDQVFIELEA